MEQKGKGLSVFYAADKGKWDNNGYWSKYRSHVCSSL